MFSRRVRFSSIHTHNTSFYSAPTENATAYTSRVDAVAPVILELNGHRRARTHSSSEEVPATKASCPMSNKSGNVSSNDAQVSVLLGVHADGSHLAHLSSLAMPGSGLLDLDESMPMTSSGCCSLPTQPTNLMPPAAQPAYPNPQSFSFPDSSFDALDAPIRAYDSDQSLYEDLHHASCILSKG